MIATNRSVLAVALMLGAYAWSTAPASAGAVADFYKDKTITVVSSGGPGGAHGIYGLLIAKYIKKYIPGNPTVIIQYVLGAGGNKGMNYLFNATRDDGTYLGVPLQDLIFNARIGVKAVKYDPTKAHYLGGVDVTRTTVTVMKVSGVGSLEDAKRKEVVMASTGKSGQTYIIPMVLNNLLGTKFRVAVLRPQRGMRLALRLSRLEVRHRGQLRRHAERAAGQQFPEQDQDQSLSVP